MLYLLFSLPQVRVVGQAELYILSGCPEQNSHGVIQQRLSSLPLEATGTELRDQHVPDHD